MIKKPKIIIDLSKIVKGNGLALKYFGTPQIKRHFVVCAF
jgi:hypothetical protein